MTKRKRLQPIQIKQVNTNEVSQILDQETETIVDKTVEAPFLKITEYTQQWDPEDEVILDGPVYIEDVVEEIEDQAPFALEIPEDVSFDTEREDLGLIAVLDTFVIHGINNDSLRTAVLEINGNTYVSDAKTLDNLATYILRSLNQAGFNTNIKR